MAFVMYVHHGKEVFVDSELKGKHQENCLCYKCKKLTIDNRESNCSIANDLFYLNLKHHVVTPVYECPNFELK